MEAGGRRDRKEDRMDGMKRNRRKEGRSPNQVLTHAARAAIFGGRARRARRALVRAKKDGREEQRQEEGRERRDGDRRNGKENGRELL